MSDFYLNLNGIIAILAIITTVTVAYFANWWRNRKNLSYEIITNTLLLTAKKEIREKLQILYEEKPVKNVHLFLIKITNNGKQPIDEKDFKKTLDFVFSEDGKILSAEIIKMRPANLQASLNFENNKISVNPILLNSKDSFEIKTIVNGENLTLNCDTRIVGIQDIKQVKENNKVTLFSMYFMFFFGFLLTLYFPFFKLLNDTFTGNTLQIIMSIQAIGILLISFNYIMSSRKK